MLRKILVIGVTSLIFTNVFAQSQEKNQSVEEMQQKFNQANNAAAAQFDKNFPSPLAANSANGKSPVVEQQQAIPPSPPVPSKPIQPQVTTEPAKKAPDIAVDADKTQTTVGNIYAAGGNAQNSDNSVNPYR